MNNEGSNNTTNNIEEPVLTPIITDSTPVISTDATPIVAASVPVQETTPVVATPSTEAPVVGTTLIAVPPSVNEIPVVVSTSPVTEDASLADANKVDHIEVEEKPKKKSLFGMKKENVSLDGSVPAKKKSFNGVLIFIIVALAFYAVYSSNVYKRSLQEVKYSCTPVNSTKENKELDINSTLVQSLYKKVYTTILEDYAQPAWDDNMRLYLAYRQVPENEKYSSNCNLFRPGRMEPYKCEVKDFTPRAFKTSALVLEWKKLFGEETPITLNNIKLQNSCVGGFQYIPERDEYVEGYCDYRTMTSFKATKSLVKATTNRNTIILEEEVKYHANESMNLPSYLVSGTYLYTFRLDMNYNYVLISKTKQEIY